MTLVIITQKDFLAMLARNPDTSICLLEGLARTVRPAGSFARRVAFRT